MAYLFNAVDDSSGEQGKQNIFGGQQTDQGTTSGQDQQQKADTFAPAGGGSGGGGGGGGGGNQSKAQVSAQQSSYNPQAASQAYASAAKSIKMPSQALSQAEGSLATGSQQLQEQANAYNQKAQETAKGYQLDQDTLSKAASGDQAAYQKTSERLQGGGQRPETYEAFGGLSTLPAIQNLRDPSSLYRAESGPNYSAGQARFDASMLRRNPEFVAKQQELLAKGKALEGESSKRATEETEKARALLKGEQEKSTADIRAQLGGMGENLVSAAKAKEAAEDARRAGLDPKALAAENQQKIKDQIKEDLKYADPRSEQARALKFLEDDYSGDLSQYVNIDKDTDWREYLGAPEAEQYNRLQGLLGSGGQMLAAAGPGGAGGDFDKDAFNRDAYRTILDQMQGKRQQQDRLDQDEIDKIMGVAKERAGGAAKKSAQESLLKNVQGRITEGGRDQAAEQVGKLFSDPKYAQQLDQILGGAGPRSWEDVLSGEEAGRLSELSQDMGALNQYQAGAYNPQYDNEALTNLYRQIYGAPGGGGAGGGGAFANAPGISVSNKPAMPTKQGRVEIRQ